MKKLIVLYFALVAAVYLGLHIEKDPGYVLIAIGQWTVETPLWFAAVITLASFFTLYLAIQFIRNLSALKFHWGQFMQSMKAKRSHNRTRQGLIAFSEGNWQVAEMQLLKGLPASDTPLINFLAAARSAQEQGDSIRRDKYLRQAELSMPDAKVAVLLTQAQLQIAEKQWEQGYATLNHLHSIVPKHPYVLKLLVRLHLEVEDWQALESLLAKIKRQKILSADEFADITKKTYLGLIKINAKYEKPSALISLWKNIPKQLHYDSEINSLYIKSLITLGETAQADSCLKAALKKNWHEDLIELFGDIQVTDLNGQLQYLEKLLKSHPDCPKLLLELGRLSNRLKLWGKAKDYLEKSAQISSQPDILFELGNLLEALNEAEQASHYYKKGLSHSLESPNKEIRLLNEARK